MREDWFRSRKTAGFSVSSAGWRFGDGDVYEVIKVGRRTAKRERERESLLSRKATREEGVNGNGLKTPTIQRKLKLSNVGGDYSQGNVRFHELQKLSLDRGALIILSLRDQLDRAFYEAIKIKACLVHS